MKQLILLFLILFSMAATAKTLTADTVLIPVAIKNFTPGKSVIIVNGISYPVYKLMTGSDSSFYYLCDWNCILKQASYVPKFYIDSPICFQQVRLWVKDCRLCEPYAIDKVWKVDRNPDPKNTPSLVTSEFFKSASMPEPYIKNSAVFSNKITFRNGWIYKYFRQKELIFVAWENTSL
jgi:hypothetical protein